MEVKAATLDDVKDLHETMILAYQEYIHIPASTSALDETIESITEKLKNGEEALVVYDHEKAIASVRYIIENDALFFERLSVIPEYRGQRVARLLLNALEEITRSKGYHTIRCKVRMSLTKNMNMYRAFGYTQYGQTIFPLRGIQIDVAKMEKRL